MSTYESTKYPFAIKCPYCHFIDEDVFGYKESSNSEIYTCRSCEMNSKLHISVQIGSTAYPRCDFNKRQCEFEYLVNYLECRICGNRPPSSVKGFFKLVEESNG